MMKTLQQISKKPWIWALLGAIIMWFALGVFAGSLSVESLITIATSASFLAIVGMGQMLVITTGGGAIDLSIPSIITLSAFLSTGLINGSDANLLYGIPIVLAIGAGIGIMNALMVLYLKIPPIIATLGMSYIVTTGIMLYNKNFRAFNIAPLLEKIARNRIFGVFPIILMIVLLLVFLLSLMLERTRYGKSLIAVGQNAMAASLAGIRVYLIQALAYVMSGLLAAFGGIMISARVGGAFLGLGDSYLLLTVASVVVGGTAITGGKAVPVGTFFGSLFLTLLTTAMQVAGLQIGIQYVITGILIILVLFLATEKSNQ
jgi:Ribose/xylose/arabinose/galactoside ABC-type transport systems, permease components